MTSTTLQVVLQAFSTLAVAGGLVYATLQLREWRHAQYVTNFTTLVALLGELRKIVVDDPTLARGTESGRTIVPTNPPDCGSD